MVLKQSRKKYVKNHLGTIGQTVDNQMSYFPVSYYPGSSVNDSIRRFQESRLAFRSLSHPDQLRKTGLRTGNCWKFPVTFNMCVRCELFDLICSTNSRNDCLPEIVFSYVYKFLCVSTTFHHVSVASRRDNLARK